MGKTENKKRPKSGGVDPQNMPPDPLEMPINKIEDSGPSEKDVAKRERARDSR